MNLNEQLRQSIVLVNNAGDAQPRDITHVLIWEYEYKNIFLSAVLTSFS
jgi:hypothetical protein